MARPKTTDQISQKEAGERKRGSSQTVIRLDAEPLMYQSPEFASMIERVILANEVGVMSVPRDGEEVAQVFIISKERLQQFMAVIGILKANVVLGTEAS